MTKVRIVSDELLIFWAKKFFPHLLPDYGKKVIAELWIMHHTKQTP